MLQVSRRSSGFVGRFGVSEDDAFASLIDNILKEYFQVRSVYTFYFGGNADIFTRAVSKLLFYVG